MTNTATTRETLGFQAEVTQLLHLMVHSLYGNKEIFLRELVSNASDAADKLRFEATTDDALFEDDPTPRIRVSYDGGNRTITVSDNGIGMLIGLSRLVKDCIVQRNGDGIFGNLAAAAVAFAGREPGESSRPARRRARRTPAS